MKVALVFDDLIQFGGAEKLLLAASEIWPEADVFTTVASAEWKQLLKDKGVNYKLSFMQRLPFCISLNRFYGAFLLHPLAFSTFDFSSYDLVISISSRFSHLITTKPSTKHVAYINSPARMFWEPTTYFKNDTFTNNLKFNNVILRMFSVYSSIFKLYDVAVSNGIDYIIANSTVPKKRIQKYYGKNSDVIFPFVDFKKITSYNYETEEDFKYQDYFLVVSRLVSWKRIDIAIKACIDSNKKLIIVGDGPDLARLKSKATSNISFLGYISDQQKVALLKNCNALIITQYEDFGITPLEAMAVGKPVLAFGKGGVLETVLKDVTGDFFYEQTSESLVELLNSFESKKYNPKDCIDRSYQFRKEIFTLKLRSFVDSVYFKDH